MNRRNLTLVAVVVAFTLLFATALFAKDATFTGKIGDSMCGLKHMMPDLTDKQCTEACVSKGAKYILADETHKKVYELSDQQKPKAFAGQAVVVKGSLEKDGKTIHVASIEAAK
jgi:ATP/ADP translocase